MKDLVKEHRDYIANHPEWFGAIMWESIDLALEKDLVIKYHYNGIHNYIIEFIFIKEIDSTYSAPKTYLFILDSVYDHAHFIDPKTAFDTKDEALKYAKANRDPVFKG